MRAPHECQHGDAVMEASVKVRSGSVLGKGCILKMYFFPGQRTSSHIQIHGAPHVYKVFGWIKLCKKMMNNNLVVASSAGYIYNMGMFSMGDKLILGLKD